MVSRVKLSGDCIDDALGYLRVISKSCKDVEEKTELHEYVCDVNEVIQEFENKLTRGESSLNKVECNKVKKLIGISNRRYLVDPDEWQLTIERVRKQRTRRNRKKIPFESQSSRIEITNDVKCKLQELKNSDRLGSYDAVISSLLKQSKELKRLKKFQRKNRSSQYEKLTPTTLENRKEKSQEQDVDVELISIDELKEEEYKLESLDDFDEFTDLD